MGSRPLLALLVILGTACVEEDPPVVQVDTVVQRPAPLVVPAELDSDRAHYRWVVIGKPPTSTLAIPDDAPDVTITPDVRGTYGVERYFSYRFDEELTHRFVITATGIPPRAAIVATNTARVGMRVPLDGSLSTSDEHLPLTLAWRLVQRPAGSTAALESLTAPMTGLTPDVAGVYSLELTASDGELTSRSPATFDIVATP